MRGREEGRKEEKGGSRDRGRKTDMIGEGSEIDIEGKILIVPILKDAHATTSNDFSAFMYKPSVPKMSAEVVRYLECSRRSRITGSRFRSD